MKRAIYGSSPAVVARRRGLRMTLALAVLLSVASGGSALAQGTGTVSGTVKDESGNPVGGATVLVIQTGRDTVTRADGTYQMTVRAGNLVLLAAAAGFRTEEKLVSVEADGRTTVDFSLAPSLSQFGEELVVLGSRAARTAIETPVPVDVLSPEDLEDIGLSETSRMIQFLAPSFNFSTSTISDGTDIVRPSTLRGLGPDQTLVLVNGKRRHNSALVHVHVNGSIGRGTAGVDLNAIPPSAIDRIEILRDGAAAQYGSDAIAGVINVILKQGTDKTRVDVTAGEHFEGDGETIQVGVNHGWRVGDGGFFNVTAEYRDRGFTNRAGRDPRQIYATLPDGSPDPREANYNRLNHRYGDAESENMYLFLNGEIPAGDGSFYFFGGLSERDGESAGFNRLPGQTRTNTLIHPDGHLPLINTSVDDTSVAVGYRGSIGDNWSYDAGVVTGDNEFNFFISNSANTSLWEASPTSADAGTLKFDQTTFTVDFFGTAGSGQRPVYIATGFEYREDGYQIVAGEPASYVDGGEPNQFCRPPWPQPDPRCGPAPAGIQVFPGFQPVNEVDASRDNIAVYGDVEIPLSDRFLLGLAARYEDYSDFGDTVDGKLTARYEVSERFAIRGSASTGFRAPSLHQSNLANISTQFVDVAGELLPVEVGTFRNPSPITRVLGVPTLKEETSTSFSLGFTARPHDNLSITADVYSIDIDDRIVLSGVFRDTIPQIAPLLRSINVGAGQFFVNALDTETEGLDLVIAYTTEVGGGGKVDLTGAFNWTSTDIVGRSRRRRRWPGWARRCSTRSSGSTCRRRSRTSTTTSPARYSKGAFSGIVRVNYFGKVASTESTTGDPAFKQTFSAKWLTDVDLSFRFGGGFKLHVGANNLFDEYPDPNIASNSFNGIFVYPRRTAPFGFNGGYYYTRLSITL